MATKPRKTMLDRIRAKAPHLRKRAETDLAWAEHEKRVLGNRREWLVEHVIIQKGRCYYCRILMRNDSAQPNLRPTLDHVVPKSKGGRDILENTVAACQGCNVAKSNLEVSEYLSTQFLRDRRRLAEMPPDRLSADPSSDYCYRGILKLGVRVFLDGRELSDVEEYCQSEGWVQLPAGKARRKSGRPVTIKKTGVVTVKFKDSDSG
ncbi:MAG: DUF3297 family protein [Parvibaculaceae bacterium]